MISNVIEIENSTHIICNNFILVINTSLFFFIGEAKQFHYDIIYIFAFFSNFYVHYQSGENEVKNWKKFYKSNCNGFFRNQRLPR